MGEDLVINILRVGKFRMFEDFESHSVQLRVMQQVLIVNNVLL